MALERSEKPTVKPASESAIGVGSTYSSFSTGPPPARTMRARGETWSWCCAGCAWTRTARGLARCSAGCDHARAAATKVKESIRIVGERSSSLCNSRTQAARSRLTSAAGGASSCVRSASFPKSVYRYCFRFNLPESSKLAARCRRKGQAARQNCHTVERGQLSGQLDTQVAPGPLAGARRLRGHLQRSIGIWAHGRGWVCYRQWLSDTYPDVS